MASSSAILSVRVTEAEKSALAYAAERSKSTISEFVRRSALMAAEEELMQRTVIDIPPERWEEIEAMVNEPARFVPAFAELAARKPVWEK